ncbi:MAG: NAD(P)-binding domain-containing protein [Deinococcales bacterium]
MDRLVLMGVSHRRGGARALEAYQQAYAGDGLERLRRAGLQEFVPIVTCNRWDVAMVVPEGREVEELRRRLALDGQQRPYAFVADGALEQLARVASSLDSLNPGEDQIMRQVREAYGAAQHSGSTGPTTAFAFETALRVAKRVRREVALAPVHASLFSLARPELEPLLPPGTAVAVLGAGEMGTLAARSLRELEGVRVLVVNRTAERAEAVARSAGAEAMPLSRFLTEPPNVTALVCATPAHHLVDAVLLSRMPSLRLAVDLGIPRNVDPAAARRRNVRVLDVDGLQAAGRERRDELSGKLAEAERIVRLELDEAVQAWTERQLGPSIRRLRALYLDTIGDALPPEAAQRLAHRFAHVPVKGLRALAREHGLDAARTFLIEAGLAEAEPVEPS